MNLVGRAILSGANWELTLQPHVASAFRRIFNAFRADEKRAKYVLPHSPAACFELRWFSQRYPMQFFPVEELNRLAEIHVHEQSSLDAIMSADYTPIDRKLAVPLRKYQSVGVDLYLNTRGLILGDDVGLGKTASAIGALAARVTLPAIVVTYPHLQTQWKREIERFLPGTVVHLTKNKKPYNVSGIDVLVTTYTKLEGWQDYLTGDRFKSITFDEIQELRREKSEKYKAARAIAARMNYVLGLSATPIYNHGGEIFNIVDVVRPGFLGTADEFFTAWCHGAGSDRSSWILDNAVALGAYLRAEKVMIRRTREDVGRELPALSKYVTEIDADEAALEKVNSTATQLARIILAKDKGARGEAMQAASEFANLLRQATGLAKAIPTAEFVKLLLESGEPVVLGGWHHSVYNIWRDHLKAYNPAFYTGAESEAQKQRARDDFTSGRTNLFILSLRSGIGIDGLQHRCRTVVLGEFDWTDSVHKQFIGRVHRDGQKSPVFAYFMTSNAGSDPIMIQTLGLKRDQSEGVMNLGAAEILADGVAENHIRKLAEDFLARRK